MSASEVAIPGRGGRRRGSRSTLLVAAILTSFAAGAAVRTTVSAAGDDPVQPMSDPAAVDESGASIHAPREEMIVAGIAEAEGAGCTVVLEIGGAPLEAGSEFRRATRMLAHGFMARQNLDRVTSEVIRVDDRLAGVVYGERCP